MTSLSLTVPAIGGTYTPTVTGISNITSVTAAVTNYVRFDGTVMVFGKVTADPITTLTPTQFRMTLPIASELANDYDLAGIASAQIGEVIAISPDVVNNAAYFTWTPIDVSNLARYFSFSYSVL